MKLKNYICLPAAIILLLLPSLSFAQQSPEENFIYNDNGKRDPFWPLVSSNGVILHYGDELTVSDMVLEGIVINPDGKNMAIINGAIVSSNEQFGVYVVEKVEDDKVILIKGQERLILKLKKEGN